MADILSAPSLPSKRLSVSNLILLGLLALALAAAGYFYWQSRQERAPAAAKTEVEEVAELVKIVGAFMALPEGETPTLATVKDREKLVHQPFFQKAENGDKVLIYTNAGRAILYRPSLNKIIDVTTVNVSSSASEAPSAQPSSEPQTSTEKKDTESAQASDKTLGVSVLNGGGEKGSAGKLAEAIKAEGYTQVSAGNTEKNYTGTTIYYSAGLEKEAENLKTVVVKSYPNATVAPALADDPETQTAPLTIIVGK